jgi:hypothetical protein
MTRRCRVWALKEYEFSVLQIFGRRILREVHAEMQLDWPPSYQVVAFVDVPLHDSYAGLSDERVHHFWLIGITWIDIISQRIRSVMFGHDVGDQRRFLGQSITNSATDNCRPSKISFILVHAPKSNVEIKRNSKCNTYASFGCMTVVSGCSSWMLFFRYALAPNPPTRKIASSSVRYLT